jgi:pilus assembly protein Flp/PilA
MDAIYWQRAEALVRGFMRDDRGTTAIEYGLIAALVAIGMLAGLRALGSGNTGSWTNTADKASNAMQGN